MIGSVEWPTLEDIMRAEGEVVLPELTEKMAYGIGCQAVDAGLQHGLPIAIGLWRGERQLFHCALPGSTRDNDEWLRRKGRVVMRFERSSLYVARLCRDQETTLAERFALPPSRFAAAGGAVGVLQDQLAAVALQVERLLSLRTVSPWNRGSLLAVLTNPIE